MIQPHLLRGLTIAGRMVGTNGNSRFECDCGVSTHDPRVSPEQRAVACRACLGRLPTLELGVYCTRQSQALVAAEQALATLRTYRTHARWTHCESDALTDASQQLTAGNYPEAARIATEGVTELYRKLGRSFARRTDRRPYRRR